MGHRIAFHRTLMMGVELLQRLVFGAVCCPDAVCAPVAVQATLDDEEAQALLRGVGLEQVLTVPTPEGAPALTVGRRPSGQS